MRFLLVILAQLLSVIAVTAPNVNLSWQPRTDNVGVAGYRDGVQIGSSPTASYIDTTAQPSTQYIYTVTAYDAVGNESGQSIPLTITTAASSGSRDIVTATSCSVGAVKAAINAASDGDLVIIPDGQCTWTSGITINKQIQLRGMHVPTMAWNATDGTTIVHAAGSADLISMNTGNDYSSAIGNIRFLAGNQTGYGNYIVMHGSGKPPLMHGMYFDLPNFVLFHAVEWFVTGGVIWNSTFESHQNLNGSCGSVIGSESGSIRLLAGLSWDYPSTMGDLDDGTKNTYFEDVNFLNVGQSPDVDSNARAVIRHSVFDSSGGLTHGSTSATGGRQVELYDNIFKITNQNRNFNRYFWFRAGTAVITGNSVQAYNYQCYGKKASFMFVVESATRSGSHGCCTGYMCYHQSGSGSDGSAHSPPFVHSSQVPRDAYQIPDPVYIWGNTGTGATGYSSYVATNDSDMSCNTGNTTATFFIKNRDYFVDSGPKPGWSRFIYPHPLRAQAR